MDKELESVRILPHLATRAARCFGHVTAIEGEDGETLTYVDLERAIRDVARACIANGVEPGDRVAIWAPNVTRWILAALGAQRAGAALVPMNTRLKGREAGYILRRSGAKLLFTVSEFLGINFPQLLEDEDVPQLEQIVLLSGHGRDMGWESFMRTGTKISDSVVQQRDDGVSGDDLSDILFTSGTTGNPKGVMTTHAQNLRVFRGYSHVLGLQAGDRYLIVNPFFNTFGYKAGWLSALMRGVTILPHAVFDPQKILQRIERDRITVLPGPPTLYQTLLATPSLPDHDLSSLRCAITGAASIPVELIERMRSDLGFRTVLTAYGLTETCGLVSMCAVSDDARTIATTSGRAIEGVHLRVVDEAGTEVGPGMPGEIVMRGYNVMKGYFEDPDETARAIDADGWLHTGDIGILDEHGYVRITDRKKDMFIVGGFNCYPAEIENILLQHPAIMQVAIIGVPDERMGEVGKAFVVLKPGTSLTVNEIIQWSRGNMANYKVPRAVEIREALPVNASGKIQKFVLRQVSAGGG